MQRLISASNPALSKWSCVYYLSHLINIWFILFDIAHRPGSSEKAFHLVAGSTTRLFILSLQIDLEGRSLTFDQRVIYFNIGSCDFV
jgi:hypothetical protein